MKIKLLFKFIFFILFIQTTLFAQLATDTTGGPDNFGHRWITSQATGFTIDYDWIDALSGSVVQINDDQWTNGLQIGFSFNFYGTSYTTFNVSSGGFISFTVLAAHYEDANNDSIPNANLPNNIIAVSWDDIFLRNWNDLNHDRKIFYRTVGTAPYRKLIVAWLAVRKDSNALVEYTFEIVLHETTNLIVFNYNSITGSGAGVGLNEATIGIENTFGIDPDGLLFANDDSPAVEDTFAILFYGDSL